MPDQFIAGCHCSGARDSQDDTWLATGTLTSLGLSVTELSKVSFHRLAQKLASMPALEAIGLDFPFSMPAEFLRFLAKKEGLDEFQSWQQAAERLVFSSLEDFLKLVSEFCLEPKRLTEGLVNKIAWSPLRRSSPSMAEITFQGVRLLATLDPARFYLVPMQDEKRGGCAVLEVLPRESLYCLGIPDSGGKSKKIKTAEGRKGLLDDLINLRERKNAALYRECPRISIPKTLENTAIESEHALSAVIACYTVALRSFLPRVFPDPLSTDDPAVLLEGWIYAPSGLLPSDG